MKNIIKIATALHKDELDGSVVIVVCPRCGRDGISQNQYLSNLVALVVCICPDCTTPGSKDVAEEYYDIDGNVLNADEASEIVGY